MLFYKIFSLLFVLFFSRSLSGLEWDQSQFFQESQLATCCRQYDAVILYFFWSTGFEPNHIVEEKPIYIGGSKRRSEQFSQALRSFLENISCRVYLSKVQVYITVDKANL